MEAFGNLIAGVEAFGTETIGRTLYTNETSDYSRKITQNIGCNRLVNSENRLLRVLSGIITGVFTTISLGQIGFLPRDASFSDRIDIAAHFTIVPLVDGGLKVLYNLSAIVGNIAMAAIHLLTALFTLDTQFLMKAVATIGFVGSNLVETIRNLFRTIPIFGHGLAKVKNLKF